MEKIDITTARRIILDKEVDHREVLYFTQQIIAYTIDDPSTYHIDTRESKSLVTAAMEMHLFHQVLLELYGELPDMRYSKYDGSNKWTGTLFTGYESLRCVTERMEATRQPILNTWMLDNPLSGRKILLTTSGGLYSDTIRQLIWSFGGTKGREARG